MSSEELGTVGIVQSHTHEHTHTHAHTYDFFFFFFFFVAFWPDEVSMGELAWKEAGAIFQKKKKKKKYYRGRDVRKKAGLGGAVGCASSWRLGGHGFDLSWDGQHSVMEIDHEIFSLVILSLPLIQEGQLSVSGERMCTILVNRLED